MQKLLITFATVIVTLTGCESDKNNPIQEPQQEKPLSFTEMKTKYVDKLLTYEYSKQETAEIQKIARSNKNSTLDLKSMSLDEKCDIINELNELKNAPKPSLVAGENEGNRQRKADDRMDDRRTHFFKRIENTSCRNLENAGRNRRIAESLRRFWGDRRPEAHTNGTSAL